jgi:hypothetical protein
MGFGAGFAGGLVNGASVGQSFKMGMKGAFWGAVSAGVAYGVAELAGSATGVGSTQAHAAGFGSYTGRVKAVMHGLSRVAISKYQYGTTKGAFASAFFTSSVGSMIGGGRFGAVKAAMVGGTASVIGGGKFANGAIGSAFQYMFNDSMTGKIAGGISGSATKKVLDVDPTLERIAASGAKYAVRGAFAGGAVGAIGDDIGIMTGAYMGAKVGFSYGILKQAILEAGWAEIPNYVKDIVDTVKGTAEGFIENVKEKTYERVP